jgi:hypothetical protein
MRSKLALLLFTILFAGSVSAFDGGLSIVKKDDFVGVAVKAEVLRIEYLEAKPLTIRNDSILAVTDRKKELNISLEPDYTFLKHYKFKLGVSPLIGVSRQMSEELHQSKVGVKCDAQGNPAFVAHPDCFAYKKKNNVSLIHGASVKFDFEPDPQLHFYIKSGIYNNGNGYQPQTSVGVTLPF